jgi:hypothetical protein
MYGENIFLLKKLFYSFFFLYFLNIIFLNVNNKFFLNILFFFLNEIGRGYVFEYSSKEILFTFDINS